VVLDLTEDLRHKSEQRITLTTTKGNSNLDGLLALALRRVEADQGVEVLNVHGDLRGDER